MSVNVNQSAIAEVRDQMSLDFADGEYLNVVSQNLGMERPILGFDDDTWRALVKQLALEYKQLYTQFYKMMEIIFGVQVTQVGTLKSSVEAGAKNCVLNETSQFPQVGTLIFDEGLPTEETHKYCYIDRHTGTVYLDGTTFAYAHLARDFDIESPVLAIADDNTVVVANSSLFPNSDLPVTVVLGRGTAAEETLTSSTIVRETGLITLDSTPTNTHKTVTPTNTWEDLQRDVYFPSAFVVLEDSSQFPASGVIRLRPTNTFTVVGDVTPATNRTIVVAADTFVESSLIGFEVLFTSGALSGRTRRVVSNTASTLTVDVDFTDEGAGPLNSTTFQLFPLVDYTSNDDDSGTLNLREALDLDTTVTTWAIPINSRVELMETQATVSLAPVKSPGQDWDIIQSTPGTVEILLPDDLQSQNDIRSASYIHVAYENRSSTTLSAPAVSTATVVSVVDASGFPDTGTAVIGPEQNSYSVPTSSVVTDIASGATSVSLANSSQFGSSGTIVFDEGTANEESVAFSANNTATGVLTINPTTRAHKAGVVVKNTTRLLLARPLSQSYGAGVTVSFYEPEYTGTSVIIGDYNQQINTWPGPYVYALGTAAPTGTVAQTTLGEIVAGPTLLSIEQRATRSVIEVEDATAYDLIPGTFSLSIGVNKGVNETRLVTGVSLRTKTATTVSSVSSNEITVADGTGFPEVGGYRIVIDELEALGTREVAYVTSRSGNVITVDALVGTPVVGQEVRLVRDVLTLETALTNNHSGLVPYIERSTSTETTTNRAYFPVAAPGDAETVVPILNNITLADTTGLDTSGGKVILNFGYGSVPVEGVLSADEAANSAEIEVVDASVFPDVFPFIVTVGAGRRYAEKLVITGKTVNALNFTGNTTFAHSAGDIVLLEPGEPETVEYDEINGNDISFDSGIMLNYTHNPYEAVIDSSADSDPRDTGYDFPLRMPDEILTRLQYLIDIIRAAGIQVVLIDKR